MPTYAVTLLPSQHSFQSSTRQSLLTAALESGLKLKYGCESGNCGECLARLQQGSVQSLRHSDFKLSEEQIAQGYLLTCCTAAQSDCRIEVEETGSVNEIQQQCVRASVYRLQRLSENVMSVVARLPRSQPLNFFAGQSVSLQVEHDLSRILPIASCPCDALKPEFHIHYQPGDEFSEYVFTQLKRNHSLEIQGPLGDFVLDDDTRRPLVFIAYDTGFAAIRSLLEHAIMLEKEQPIKLYWIITAANTAYLENYCRSIEDALDNFRYSTLALDEATHENLSKLLKIILTRETAIKYSDVFMTVPQAFYRSAEAELINAGIDDRHWSINALSAL